MAIISLLQAKQNSNECLLAVIWYGHIISFIQFQLKRVYCHTSTDLKTIYRHADAIQKLHHNTIWYQHSLTHWGRMTHICVGNSIMMLVKFADLSQLDRSNWVMWQVKDPCPRPGWDGCLTREKIAFIKSVKTWIILLFDCIFKIKMKKINK